MNKILTFLDNVLNALSMAILWIAFILMGLFVIYKLIIFDREYTKDIVKEAIQEIK